MRQEILRPLDILYEVIYSLEFVSAIICSCYINLNKILFLIFRLILNHTEFCLFQNQSENG